MKLLIDCHEFDKSHQGTTVYVKNLFSRLMRDRDDIQFILCARDIEGLRKIFGNEHHYIRLTSSNLLTRILFEYPRIIKKYKVDYCHFNYIIPLIKSRSCKYLVTIHDVLFLDFKNLFSWRYILPRAVLFNISAKRSNHVYTVSKYSKERIRKKFRIKEDKITVLVNGINHMLDAKAEDKFLPEDIFSEKYILSVGRIETRKNQEMLLDIYLENKYYENEIKLVYVGSKAFSTKQFQNKIKDLKSSGLEKNVVFLENVSKKILITLYKYCLVHVYISKCEGFGIPPLESAAMGALTICSNTTAMSDFDFFNGFHVNPSDENKIKTLIDKAVNGGNKLLMNDLKKVQRIIKDKYDWNQSANILNSQLIK